MHRKRLSGQSQQSVFLAEIFAMSACFAHKSPGAECQRTCGPSCGRAVVKQQCHLARKPQALRLAVWFLQRSAGQRSRPKEVASRRLVLVPPPAPFKRRGRDEYAPHRGGGVVGGLLQTAPSAVGALANARAALGPNLGQRSAAAVGRGQPRKM